MEIIHEPITICRGKKQPINCIIISEKTGQKKKNDRGYAQTRKESWLQICIDNFLENRRQARLGMWKRTHLASNAKWN